MTFLVKIFLLLAIQLLLAVYDKVFKYVKGKRRLISPNPGNGLALVEIIFLSS